MGVDQFQQTTVSASEWEEIVLQGPTVVFPHGTVYSNNFVLDEIPSAVTVDIGALWFPAIQDNSRSQSQHKVFHPDSLSIRMSR